MFNYNESTNSIVFYGVQFTIEAIDAAREIFSLSDIIKTAKTKEPLVHVINDFEYTLRIIDDTAEIRRKELPVCSSF
jgi:hypothetical protein